MPIITVAMYSGRTQRDKDRLAEAITDDVVNILKVEKKDVIIVFRQLPMETGMLLESVFGKRVQSKVYRCMTKM
ncbi:MAG TPA: tautomerase family protein [Nitrososphaeraceae archaeon]|jgi:4-oxalocrotonate tautomerase|nr:tautomerase family protein [Nitrososphaeraceae archaeon]